MASKLNDKNPENAVILWQFGRAKDAPSLSPFPLKLETYLRMANIPYKNKMSSKMSTKGKTPWMEINGENVPDSSFCIEYLNEKFNVDLNQNLSLSDRAVARAFQKLVEENLYWVLVYARWVDNHGKMLENFLEVSWIFRIFKGLILSTVKKQLHAQGMGRHSKEEIYHIAEKDLAALSDFLGEKQFFFGDEPCEQDASYFGMLAQLKWQMYNSPLETLIRDKFKNLSEYCQRMKERYWPDWNDCVLGHKCNVRKPEAPESDTTVLK